MPVTGRVQQSSASSEAGDEEKKGVDPKVKAQVASLRKAHGDWDRTKRLWQGILAKSRVNENTSGCAIL